MGQAKHAKKIFGQSTPSLRAAAFRRWGWGCLLLSLLCQLSSASGDFVIILYPMFFGVGGLVTALVIAFYPSWLRVLRVLPGVAA